MMTLSKSKWLFASRFELRIVGLLTLSLVWMPTSLTAQNAKYTVEPTKLDDDKAKSAKEKEKNSELKSDKTDLTAFTEFYTGYIIPKLTEATPTELNARRRDVETDMESVGKNKSKAVQAAFNKKVYELFSNVAKNPPGKSYNPGTRITAMILLTQLTREPAGKNPAVPDPDVLKDLYVVLDPKRLSDPKTREIDAMLYIAIKSLEKYLRAQPTNPADGFPDRLRKAFVTRIAEHMTMDPPVPRLPDAHQKMMEQALLTMTLFAIKNSAETPKGTVNDTQKAAAETVTKFVVKVFNDERSSEWLKEIACACLGQITPSALTPEEATKLENEIAKFAIKSLKDWRVKIAMSGSLAAGGMGGYGSGGMGGTGGIPGGSGDGGYGGLGVGDGMGSEGGYGMGTGQNNPAAKGNVFDKQPPEVKNARRMIHQRLERIHLGLNGFPRKYPDSNPLAKNPEKGLVTLVADGEKDKIRDAVEKLEKLQSDLNNSSNNPPVLDLMALSTVVRLNLKEFRLACVAISGEEKEKAEMDAANPFGNSGAGE